MRMRRCSASPHAHEVICVTIIFCMGMPAIILASTSPRRRQLFAWTGWSFEVSPVEIDETPYSGEAPDVYVSRLAQAKGAARARQAAKGGLILAADTTVADGMAVLGKPTDPTDAVRMLTRLRGRTHQVYTALSMVTAGGGPTASERCASNVPMRAYSDAEIAAYVATGDPLDKAGAYAIQHPEFRPVEDFQGCFASVMGLPLCHLVRAMARLGHTPPNDVSAVCQTNLDYDCPVTRAILRGEDVG
jgi:septum formation protein